MEVTMLQTQWGPLIAIYLFLGGLAGGTLLVSSIIGLKKPGVFTKTVRFGAWAGTILLIVGVLCLLAETTMPTRAMIMWQSFSNPTSWMTIGAWLLFCGIVAAGLYALAVTPVIADKAGFLKKIQRPLAVLAAVFGCAVAVYTGILLCVLVAHPLWNTFLIPVLFTVSAVDTGVALVLAYLVLRENRQAPGLSALHALLEKITVGLVLAELAVLAVLLVSVAAGSDVGALSVQLLTSGSLAVWFWGVLVLCGLVVPLVLALATLRHPRKTQKTPLAHTGAVAAAAPSPAASAETPEEKAAQAPAAAMDRAGALTLTGAVLCLIGGCTLRFLILLAGLPLYL